MFVDKKELRNSGLNLGGKHNQSKVFNPRCSVCSCKLDIHSVQFPGCCSRECAVKSKQSVDSDVFDRLERDLSECCCCGLKALVSLEGRICKVLAYRCIDCRTADRGSRTAEP